jgi:hypothetical protein
MQHWDSDPPPWHIVPVKPGDEAGFRRWNIVVISILAALVLAVFLSVVVPQTPRSISHKAPSKVHHASLMLL